MFFSWCYMGPFRVRIKVFHTFLAHFLRPRQEIPLDIPRLSSLRQVLFMRGWYDEKTCSIEINVRFKTCYALRVFLGCMHKTTLFSNYNSWKLVSLWTPLSWIFNEERSVWCRVSYCYIWHPSFLYWFQTGHRLYIQCFQLNYQGQSLLTVGA